MAKAKDTRDSETQVARRGPDRALRRVGDDVSSAFVPADKMGARRTAVRRVPAFTPIIETMRGLLNDNRNCLVHRADVGRLPVGAGEVHKASVIWASSHQS